MTGVRVDRTRRLPLLGAFLVLIALAIWAVRHAFSTMDFIHGKGTQLGVIFTIAFVMLAFQTVLYYLEPVHHITDRQERQLNGLYVTVPVPLYNEDPDLLLGGLMSLLDQERRPNMVYVVDDGSAMTDPETGQRAPVDYTAVRRQFSRAAAQVGVETRWVYIEHGGKRRAQAEAVRNTPQTDIYVTVDSDAFLPRDAIRELLKPLANPRVQSVAGVVLASNNRKNLLTRFTDLWFVTGQLVDRSSQSTMGSVLVNSGVLAAYRGSLLRDFLPVYLNETFFGRKVEFSDDSMLTIFALSRGKAVQQPTAYALTTMPERLPHHVRQYTRWMRGAFIRSWWRFKYLRLSGYAFWSHLMGWIQMAISTAVFGYLFVVSPIMTKSFSPWLLTVPILVGYAQALRYLSFRRTDESLGSQLLTFAMSPIATLWMFFVLRPIRWYAIATCWKTGWGTRQTIEVTAEGGTQPASVPRHAAEEGPYLSVAGTVR